MSESTQKTALYDHHVALGARMVPFAGYDMPVQYEGVMAEHKWTRAEAGLFDVSHMGQARIEGAGATATLESLTPTDFDALGLGKQKYSLLLDEQGGIHDDWMVSRPFDDGFMLVVNAGCKQADFEIIKANLKPDTQFTIMTDRSLLALQGPKAKDVMHILCPKACDLYFMDCGSFEIKGEVVFISRSGYTGEDGFEISLPSAIVGKVWDELLTFPQVKPIGLGARDSLRLEAGMPLYGHEMDLGYNLMESGLSFGMSKSRRERGDIRGMDAINAPLKRVRVGLKSLEGPPAREGAKILDDDKAEVGIVTSGLPSPSLGYGIAMGYVPPTQSAIGTKLWLEVRGKAYRCEIVPMPFVSNGYHRRPKA